MRISRLVLVLALAASSTALNVSAGAVDGPLHRSGRWLVDDQGRVVILHGLNMSAKRAPYEPSALGFDADDAQFLAREGFNSVRLGLIYKGMEPVRNAFDDEYLESIAATAHLLGENGIKVLVDFHQDLFNEQFNGEGMPDWYVMDDGLPHQPDAGFPGNYFAMPALWRAFDHLWANDELAGGVKPWDAFANGWVHAAQRLSLEPAVFGYDVFNEPWPGTHYPTCVNPLGCPLFDARLTQFFSHVFDAIRAVDQSRVVMYETHPVFGGGADVSFGDTGDENAAFSFHVYCLGATVGVPSEYLGEASCPLGEDRPFERAEAQAQRTGDALLLTEFGATDDLSSILRDLDAADRHMVGWEYWTYHARDVCCERPQEGIVIDPHQAPEGANVKGAKLDVLTRPYPRAVAGTPSSWRFHWDAADRLFEMEYVAYSGIAAPTEVSVPLRQYPSGYTVSITGPAEVTSLPGAAVLTLRSTGDGTVRVEIKR
jgi:endoglycosylceramidase